jgi:hypothetical protein
MTHDETYDWALGTWRSGVGDFENRYHVSINDGFLKFRVYRPFDGDIFQVKSVDVEFDCIKIGGNWDSTRREVMYQFRRGFETRTIQMLFTINGSTPIFRSDNRKVTSPLKQQAELKSHGIS